MPIIVALAVGFDPWLFEAQRTVWQSAHCFVTAEASMTDAIDQLKNGDFDLVLLDPSIPHVERDRLIARIRASGSSIPVVCITDSPASAQHIHSPDLEYVNIENLRAQNLAARDQPHQNQPLENRQEEMLHSVIRTLTLPAKKPPASERGDPNRDARPDTQANPSAPRSLAS